MKQKYLDKLNGYLSDFDKKFCTTEPLKKVDRKQAGKDRLLKVYGGTPPDGAPSVFMFRELGIKTMDLQLVLS